MNDRLCASASAFGLVLAAALCAPAFAAAQELPASKTTATAKTDAGAAKAKPWVMPRTADGHPDLHGYWTSLSFTPLERPAKYQGREFLTEKEMQEAFKAGVQSSYEPGSGGQVYRNSDLFDPTSGDYDATTYGLTPWQNGVRPNPRTSLIVDPPDGKIPALTPEAQAAGRGRPTPNFGYVVNDSHGGSVVHANSARDLGVETSCLFLSGGPPMPPGLYNSGLLITQSAGALLIETEYGSETRIIPLDGSSHAGADIHKWHGDSRGHWEGDTLVVETANFRKESVFRNANPNALKVTERFTRVAKEQIEYKFTIEDPTTWTKPWSAIVPLNAVPGPMFEYDCSEDNNDAVVILAGARSAEREENSSAPAPNSEKRVK